MSVNRLIFALVFLVYLTTLGSGIADTALVNLTLWALLGLLIFVHIRIAGGRHRAPRRALALLCDMGFLTWFLHTGGPVAAPFYPVYIWIALGNGFRFGRPWLLGGMASFLAGFGWVVLATPYWRDQPYLATGLLLGPCILGLYASLLIHKLSHARQLAEQANAAKSLFLASVSHDLRTPLHAIIGTGDLLRGTGLDPDQREMTRTIDDAAQTLLSRIGGILEFCRLDSGGVQLRRDRFAPGPLLAEVRRLVAVQAREKGLWLAIHVADGTPGEILGDRAHLRDVLLNLAGNAVKFTHAGGVAIAVGPGAPGMLRFAVTDTGIGIDPAAARRIFDEFVQADASIMNRYGGTGLGLAICRSLVRMMGGEIGVEGAPGQGSSFWFTLPAGPAGPGAADAAGLPVQLLSTRPAATEAVLDRLARSGASASAEPVTPTALAALCGLPAAECPDHVLVCGPGRPGTAEALLIALDADPPAGSLPPLPLQRCFLTVLPAEAEAPALRAALGLARSLLPDPPPAAAEAALPDGLPGDPPDGAGARVLIADDNAVNRRVLQRLLERAGFAVATAADGQEALDLLDEGGIDLAVMDVNMPVLDGVEATKLHRFTALGGPRLPILGLTADAAPETARRCLEAGMDQVLTKPLDEAALLAALGTWLPRRAPAPGAAPEPPAPAPGPAAPPMLDPAVLDRLLQLGGAEFLAEVAADFTTDAGRNLALLEEALEAGDAVRFRAAAHGLRSSAASVGAARLRALAAEAEAVRIAGFAAEAPRHMALLAAEVQAVCARLAEPGSGGGRAPALQGGP